MTVHPVAATDPRPARPAPTPRRGIRFGDYRIGGGMVTLRKTGNAVPLDRRLFAEVAGWLVFQAALQVRRLGHRRSRTTIWFTPDVPHPRYMVRAAALWAGIRVARSPASASVAFYFEDATTAAFPAVPATRGFNFACTDISKSHVAAMFEAAFGYPLALDPRRHSGPAVEKAEANGAHDGRIVECPCEPAPGKAYQRLIDTIDANGDAVDLRTHCIGGRPVVVWVKRRPAAVRFLAPNTAVARFAPAEIFSATEQAQIADFLGAMGADWASLDILRDRDGRIYVVDVNKTDAGPIVALSLREKLAGVAILARALEALIVRPPERVLDESARIVALSQ
ncbi:hypothetical protein KX816_10350 [Sphingosinicellaceae bacterium]|nr:hypothetical protein KX816_10350 [Sphingosinicellaceae bacterium]